MDPSGLEVNSSLISFPRSISSTSMANNATEFPIWNPYTPMAFLPPLLAQQITISTYILVGSCSIIMWDVLNNMANDILLLTKYKITYPTIIYFISRLGSVGYVLGSTIFETAPTGNCATFEKVVDWLFPVAVPSTSLLFFFRVRAVCDKNRYITAFFAFTWLSVLAGCLTVTQGVVGAHIGKTQYCINASLQNYVAAAAIIPLFNDTLIFIAISWRLMLNFHLDNNLRSGARTLIFGSHMPAFSKSLLHEGQIYYLTTVTTNLMTVIMLYIKDVPVSYRTMFTVPNIMLMNIMACRVFRNTKLGVFHENTFNTCKSTIKEDRFTVPFSLTSGNGASASAGERQGCRVSGQQSDSGALEEDSVEISKYENLSPAFGDHNV